MAPKLTLDLTRCAPCSPYVLNVPNGHHHGSLILAPLRPPLLTLPPPITQNPLIKPLTQRLPPIRRRYLSLQSDYCPHLACSLLL